MLLTVDNKIVEIFAHDSAKKITHPLLSDASHRLSFKWPSLLQFLELDALFLGLPPFDETQPLFTACVVTLNSSVEKEVLYYVYDRLFAEILSQIQAFPQINAAFLLKAIKERRQKASFAQVKEVLAPVLDDYEVALKEKPSQTMHDLILYLAWDRVCVCVARLFDYQTTDPQFITGISVLRECLIESYHHIAHQGETSPSIYRMLEALLIYQMREENLEKHVAADWTLLTQSFLLLKEPEELVDFFYLDDENFDCYLTLDSAESVHARQALAHYLVGKLEVEFPQWKYTLRPKKIVHLSGVLE